MIRVGSSTSGVSSMLNDFHSKTAPITSGLSCNTTDSVDPPPPDDLFIPRMAYSQTVPPIPTSLKDGNFLIWRNPFSPTVQNYPLPLPVSSTYLTVTRVSGGFQVAKTSGYSGTALVEIPSSFELTLGHGLQTNDISYVRVGDVLPSPTTFTWLSSASGTTPRVVVGYSTGVVRDGQNFSPACGGTNLYEFGLTYGSVDLKIQNIVSGSKNVIPALSSWSGSSLGGSSFTIVIFMTSCGELEVL